MVRNMKFWNNFKDFFKSKASKVSAVILSGLSPVIWPDRNYENFAKEGYIKNVIMFKCIDEVAKAVSSVPWRVFKNDEKGDRIEIDRHFLLDLIRKPNPHESFNFLTIKSVAYQMISGNVYWEKVGPSTGPNTKMIKELYVHRPDRMRILTDTAMGLIIGYEYEANGRTVKWDIDPITGEGDILHIKNFHPTDDWYGLAITDPAAREIDTFNEATTWNKKLLENDARPGMIFSVVGNLSDQQFEKLEKTLKEKFSGYGNAGRSLILEGENGTKAQPFSWSPAEMDFIEGNRELARRIAYAFGVPPMLVGIPGDNTYSNYKEARLAFWETTVLFYLDSLKSELNSWLFGDADASEIYIDYMLDNVPALEPRREEAWRKANEATFLTINEKRKLVGMEKHSAGDVILVQASLVPLEAVTDPSTDGDESDEDLEEDEKVIIRLRRLGYNENEIADILGRNG